MVISKQLQKEIPGLTGFGETSLKDMRTFYEEWQPVVNRQPAADDLSIDERHVLLQDARDCINKAVGHDKQNVLVDELKNDTVQFDLAVERFKINSDYIDNRISDLMVSLTESLYDIENFCMDNESKSKLSGRFLDLFPVIRTGE